MGQGQENSMFQLSTYLKNSDVEKVLYILDTITSIGIVQPLSLSNIVFLK